ncbi:hypothetical protein [Sulfurospirillum sp. 1612]
MQNDFDPINLKEASKHLEWLIDKTKRVYKPQEKTFFQKFIDLLKRVF